jgi:cytochrome P450
MATQNRSLGLTDDKYERKASTTTLMKQLDHKSKSPSTTFKPKMNAHIPNIKQGDVVARELKSLNRLLDKCHDLASSPKGRQKAPLVVQTNLYTKPMIFIEDPAMNWQVQNNRANLKPGESGGVQESLLGEGTPVSLAPDSKDDLRSFPVRAASKLFSPFAGAAKPILKVMQPVLDAAGERLEPVTKPFAEELKPYWKRFSTVKKPSIVASKDYARKRSHIMKKVFAPIADIAKQMPEIMTPYLEEMKNAAYKRKELDIELFTCRIAMTMICETQLGFKDFAESEKLALARLIHQVMVIIPKIENIRNLAIEDALKSVFLYRFNLTPELKALVKEGEKIVANLIERNKKSLLEKLNAEVKKNNKDIREANQNKEVPDQEPEEPEFTEKDLKSQDLMSYVKLFLVGGSETTSKLLLHSFLMAADPKNQDFMNEIRNERDPVRLNLLMEAFAFEVLRLFPPFSTMRFTAAKEFRLAQDMKMPEDRIAFQAKSRAEREGEYKRNLSACDRDNDVVVPEGALIAASVYHIHRQESAYGKDAKQFNPHRWISVNPETKAEELNISMDQAKLFNLPYFLTVGNSPRLCPGRKFSITEHAKVLLPVLQQYLLRSDLNGFPAKLDVGFTLELAEGEHPMMAFIPRQQLVKEMKAGADEGYQAKVMRAAAKM